MISPQRYFAEVANKRRELDGSYPSGFCCVVSILNMDKNTTAGSIAEVSTAIAAKGIVDGTQRLLTPDELVSHMASEARRKKQITVEDREALRGRINASLGIK